MCKVLLFFLKLINYSIEIITDYCFFNFPNKALIHYCRNKNIRALCSEFYFSVLPTVSIHNSLVKVLLRLSSFHGTPYEDMEKTIAAFLTEFFSWNLCISHSGKSNHFSFLGVTPHLYCREALSDSSHLQ
jgi:hypothetical protein